MDSNIEVWRDSNGYRITHMTRREAEELLDEIRDCTNARLTELIKALDDVLRNGNS